jgi:hypothetical protein
MYEYLAYTCATAGGLREALDAGTVGRELLRGAGDIIRALITGGPAQDIDDYEDGALVVERYLHHLGTEPKELEHLLVVNHIGRFLDGEADWAARERRGWTSSRRLAIRNRVVALKGLPHWRDMATTDLASSDPAIFYRADEAAKALGIDTWDHHFARLESGGDDGWFQVMQTDDPVRIDRVVALAEKVLPLDEIAGGPAEEMGLGAKWRGHHHLDFVLQDLGRFAGKGWPLIRAGLRSPVIRNRHMALRALSSWKRADWPPEAEPLLRTALGREPDGDVRQAIHSLLSGER